VWIYVGVYSRQYPRPRHRRRRGEARQQGRGDSAASIPRAAARRTGSRPARQCAWRTTLISCTRSLVGPSRRPHGVVRRGSPADKAETGSISSIEVKPRTIDHRIRLCVTPMVSDRAPQQRHLGPHQPRAPGTRGRLGRLKPIADFEWDWLVGPFGRVLHPVSRSAREPRREPVGQVMPSDLSTGGRIEDPDARSSRFAVHYCDPTVGR
jgi:hypothetical protein